MSKRRLSHIRTFVEFTGAGDGCGNIEFNKGVTFTALWSFIFCIVTDRNPAWSLLSFGIIVIGAGFGLKGYLGGVRQNSMDGLATSHVETNTADVIQSSRAIYAARDEPLGVDPA